MLAKIVLLSLLYVLAAGKSPVALESASECEGKTLSLSCPADRVISVISANYGRTSGECPHLTNKGATKNLNCTSENSQRIVTELCDGQNSCEVKASNGVFGDPCRGTYKYLEVSYRCKKACRYDKSEWSTCDSASNRRSRKLTLKAGESDECETEKVKEQRCVSKMTECEGKTLSLECPKDKVISVKGANYGRSGSEMCPHTAMTELDCKSNNSMPIVKRKCDGRRRCKVDSKNGVFGDPCRGTYKYLDVDYMCVTGLALGKRCEGRSRPCAGRNSVCSENRCRCRDGTVRDEDKCVRCDYDKSEWSECNAETKTKTKKFTLKADQHEKCPKEKSKERRCRVPKVVEAPAAPTNVTGSSMNSHHTFACEGKTLSFDCPEDMRIKINAANYGRLLPGTERCPHRATKNTTCGHKFDHESYKIVRDKCDGKKSCEIKANNGVFGDPCRGTYKYLDVHYLCMKESWYSWLMSALG